MKITAYIKDNYLLLSILFIAAVLRIYHIGFQSPWLDEIHTLNEANPSNSLKEIYGMLLDSEPHPPLYFYIIHFCFKIFGYTIETARMFSVICGVAGVYAIYLLARTISNKRIGIIAALLLSVNAFHIQYSQDARMYAFFCLFTTLSLYSFVKFIKSPTWSNTVYYAVFSALMIYGHFFGLLGLFAQYVMLLIFIINGTDNNRKALISKSIIAGFIILLLYLPAFKLFFKAAGLENIWIPKPEPDIYIELFKTLTGGSAIFAIAFSILIILYAKIVFSTGKIGGYLNTNTVTKLNERQIFKGLLIWLVVILIIPLLKSYISLPMIVERYFINILPVILILAATGLFTIRSITVRYITIIAIVVISLYNLVFVDKYYSVVAKAQFREVTQFITKNNEDNAPIISALGWYLPYFFNNDSVDYNIKSGSLQEYVDRIIPDSTNIQSFWYFDAHGRQYSLSPKAESFLERHYYLEASVEGFNAWSKFYKLKKDVIKTINKDFEDIKQENGNPILYNIDDFKYSGNVLKMSGWAFLKDANSANSIFYLVAVKDQEAVIIPADRTNKTGMNEYFKLTYDATNSGFVTDTHLNGLKSGTYKIGFYIKNIHDNKKGLVLSEKTIDIH